MSNPPDPKSSPLIDEDRISTYSQPEHADLHRLEGVRNLTCLQRLFRRPQKGSMRTMITTWFRICIGVGIMALPKYIEGFGLALGIAMIILAGFISIFAYAAIFEARDRVGAQDLISTIGGVLGPRFHKAAKATMVLDQFFALLIHVVISWNLMCYIIIFFNGRFWNFITPEMWEDIETYSLKQYHPEIFRLRAIFFSVLWVLLIPLFLKKKMESLKVLSLGYLVLLFFLVGVVVIEGPSFRASYISHEDYTIDYTSTPPSFKWVFYFFSVLLGFYCQSYVIHLRNELLHPTPQRLSKALRITMGSEILLYVFFGGFAYFCFGKGHIPDLIFLRKPFEGKGSDMIIQVAVMLFFVFNTVSLPVYTSGLRENLARVSGINTDKAYYINSLLPSLLVHVICILYPNIIAIFGLTGTTLYYFNGYFLPFRMKATLLRQENRRALAAAIDVANYTMMVLGWLVFAVEIYSQIYPDKK